MNDPARCALLPVGKSSVLTALALIAAAMHAGDAEVRVRVGIHRVGVVDVMNRCGRLFYMTGMRVCSRPARPQAHPLLLGLKQSPDLLGGLLGGDGFLA